YVDASSDVTYANGSPSAKFSKIQYGVNAASTGDTVSVAAGTYVENIYIDKNIAVLGEDRETTIIDGDSSGHAVNIRYVFSSSGFLLSGFTIQNGVIDPNADDIYPHYGGGIKIVYGYPAITDLIIIGNSAQRGGGIAAIAFDTLDISGVIVRDNYGEQSGGGIYIEAHSWSNLNISDAIIEDNIAAGGYGSGGGLYIWDGNSYFTNVTISGNEAQGTVTGSGGGLRIENANPLFTNVTITGNSADTFGGGIYCGNGSILTMVNSILWNDSPQEIYLAADSDSVSISYSNLQDGQDSVITNGGTVNWGQGNIVSNPLFCDPDSGNYTLAANSPCVGTGENRTNMGSLGIGCGIINQGIYVPEVFATIQEGIDAAINGDTVFVAAGTFVENINFNGKNIAMFGAGIDSTIIDGNQDTSVVIFSSGEDSSTIISGFTLKNGQARNGGGIYCNNNSRPRIENLIITNNVADFGGGIQCFDSSPTIQNVIITGNTAGNDGGGIHCYNGSPTLQNVEITNNTSTWKGGGLYCFSHSNVTLQRVTMNNNSSNNGGGVYCEGSNPTITNSILWNNLPEEIYILRDPVTVSYSNVLGGWEGQGNINAQPLFCSPDTGNYKLAENSPCIGTGQNGVNMGAYDIGCEPILAIASEVLPETYAIHQNYPNPFNPVTTLRYDLPENGLVTI
ncbi:uncharacterized protein METZ01_LOCUS171455, partial [marine metagenome]